MDTSCFVHLDSAPAEKAKYGSRRLLKTRNLRASASVALDLTIDLCILEERIQGNWPAVEGIRIVRERKETNDATSPPQTTY